MSTPYLDTGFALKRYVKEPNSPAAKATLLSYSPPLPLTDYLEMEIVNALHGKVFRGEITDSERDQCLANLQSDITAGFWIRTVLNSSSLRNRVLAMVARHTATLGCRTLDVIHVAAAQELGCSDLLSFDGRQRRLAVAEGMNVFP